MPLDVNEAGGFESEEGREAFLRFVKKCFEL
jgi:beta-glucosidase/6-phospho-beta-glucosidase/beta-galactosidase